MITNYYSIFLSLNPTTAQFILVNIVALIMFSGNTFHFGICWGLGKWYGS